MTELETLACITRVVVFSDQRAFEKIVRAYEQPLRQFLLSQTGGDSSLTDDLAQDTFIRAWEQLRTFRRASQFRTWLFSIAYHLYMDDCRRRQSHRVVDVALLSLSDGDSVLMEEAEEQLRCADEADSSGLDNEAWVQRAMEQIPEPARTCLTLFFMQDMTAAEVARITGLTEKNVRQIIFRYKPKLRNLLIQTRNEAL